MYILAKDLGLTVKQIMTEMTHAEFMGWAAYYKAEAQAMQHQQAKARAKR